MSRTRNLPSARRLFTRRRPRLSIALFAVAAAVLTACQPEQAPPRPDYSDIKVEWASMRVPVAFAAGKVLPDAAQMSSVDEFLTRVDVRLTDEIALAPAAGSDRELATARTEALTQALRKRLPGVQVRLLENSTVEASQLIVGRYVAIPPECPGWFSPEQRHAAFANPENTPDSNFGCANALNFAAMIANPEDLNNPTSLGAADGRVHALAVRKYRKGESPHPHSTTFSKSNVREIE